MKNLIGIAALLFIVALVYVSGKLYLDREYLFSWSIVLVWILGLSVWIKKFAFTLNLRRA